MPVPSKAARNHAAARVHEVLQPAAGRAAPSSGSNDAAGAAHQVTNCLPHWADSAEAIWSNPAVAPISVRRPAVLTSAVRTRRCSRLLAQETGIGGVLCSYLTTPLFNYWESAGLQAPAVQKNHSCESVKNQLLARSLYSAYATGCTCVRGPQKPADTRATATAWRAARKRYKARKRGELLCPRRRCCWGRRCRVPLRRLDIAWATFC